MMPRQKPSLIPDDDRILDDFEIAKEMRISVATLRRRRKEGKAPPRTQLSTRRFGTSVRNLRLHLERNTEKQS
jgi:hypothetical protein